MTKVIYSFLIGFFYIPYVVIIFLRKFFNKEHNTKFKEKILPIKFERPEGFLFWFHAASIGELNSILPLIDFYLEKNKKNNFLITTVTVSSFHQLMKKYKNNKRIFHQFLPYDSNFLINNFFENWKPNIVSFVDSEIWPNFIFKIKKEGLPFILLNARITKKTFNRWKLVKNFASEVFNTFSISISSNKETTNYLDYLKAKNVKYFGNIKFCSPVEENKKIDSSQFDLIVKKKLWCALSIHPGEEIFCGKVHKIVKMNSQNSMLIIIPRHTNKVKKIYVNLKKMGFKVQIKSENEIINESAEVVLVNYYGSIKKYLKNINQIFIGKSLLSKLKNVGGQNPIDAAKIGCRIYHGPYVYNFQEIYDYLDNEKISEKINKVEVLAEKLTKNFESESQMKNKENNKLSVHSNKIFQNIIMEYEKFVK
tara:strand:- start:1648 stop:2916 length:1269 start_codon:yes stop_codon:yes gene_type:complete